VHNAMIKLILLLLGLFSEQLIAESVRSEPIKIQSLTDFEKRVQETFPSIGEFAAEVQRRKTELDESTAPFDVNFQSGREKTSGFYNNDESYLNLNKKTSYWGAEWGAGWRNREGLYPSYQEPASTQQGEFFARITIPLLRGGQIDSIRTQIGTRDAEMRMSVLRLQMESLRIRTEAFRAVWQWVRWQEVSKVLNSLRESVEKRQKWIERKVALGNFAKIVSTENRKLLYVTEEQIVLASNMIKEEEEILKFFLGVDSIDNSVLLLEHARSYFKFEKLPEVKFEKKWLETHPLIRELYFEKETESLRLRLARNERLPDLNLQFEGAEPQGRGLASQSESEQKIQVQLQLPIEFTAARAQLKRAKIGLEQIDFKIKRRKGELIRDQTILQNRHQALIEQAKLLNKQIEVDQSLKDAEEIAFDRGVSSMLNLNLREQSLLATQIKFIALLAQIQVVHSELAALMAKHTLVP
jgi:outer membrane protein TolC